MARKSSLQDVLEANIQEHKNEMKAISKSTLLNINKPIKFDTSSKWNTARTDPVRSSYNSPRPFDGVKQDSFSDRMFLYVLGPDKVIDKQNPQKSSKAPLRLKSLNAKCELTNLTDLPVINRRSSPEVSQLASDKIRSPEKFHFSSPRYPSRDHPDKVDRSAEESVTPRELLPHYLQPSFKSQYSELIRFRTENIRDKDEKERQILAGSHLIRHLERRLKSRLDKIKELGQTPNFCRLQIYADIFDELISESWMFGSLLKQIKCAYDAEVERVLEMPVSQKELLQSEIEQLRTSIYHKEKLENLQSEVVQIQEAIRQESQVAEENKILLEQEEKKLDDLIEAKAKVDEEKRKAFKPELVSNIPTEAEKLELLKVQCWDIMDEISQIKKDTKQRMTSRATVVHLSGSLQDIEMEVEKLNSHKNQLDLELAPMREEFDQLLANSDISEDHYKIIQSLLSEPSLSSVLDYEESDKWNWYIS